MKYNIDVGEMLRAEQLKQERLAQSSDPKVTQNARRSAKELANAFPGARKHFAPKVKK